MRKAIVAGLGLLMLSAGAAQAAPVSVGELQLTPKMTQKFERDFGTREIAPLAEYANQQVSRELTKAGGQVGPGGLRVELTLLNAKPTKPTFKQMGDKLGLDYSLSKSLGGARLEAKFIGANGAVIDTIEGGYYEPDLRYSFGVTPWYDAQRGIRDFARTVGQRYATLAQTNS